MSSDTDEMDVDKNSKLTALARQDTKAKLDEKYPNRPHNRSCTLPFHTLFENLFNPLNDNKKKPTGPAARHRRRGPRGEFNQNPHDIRRTIIENYISRWRREVGNDIYPAFRLILPEKDRERAMYGLKEKILGRMFVKIMKIDKNSEDGFNLLNWKLPGQTTASRMAGDFAGRCFEVISKRPMRTTVGDMTIKEVNDMLDQLAAAPKEENQLPILQQFYKRMNAEELMWLIRVILRQMKIGASEKTIFDVWHRDAESLFNVSSSLRRVCWELHDLNVRLEGAEKGANLMQCFQPQLAQFQTHSFQTMVERMRPTEDDPVFWIEEKLDGERMQLHMVSDDSVPGGKRFRFWSRKAKDYTYLYGNSFQDENGGLTRYLSNAFDEGVKNIILDGEMIEWDPEMGQIPFGSLKTAAIEHQQNPFAEGKRPLLRVFDILYLNDRPLTRYTLRDRYRALERSVKSVKDRFEIHPHTEATSAAEIEPQLRNVIEKASEGLVMKNPRSAYNLNDRNDDWMKVKPEYMTEFGESLDCIVIGGYYGSGHRGGNLSSFLCGLKVAEGKCEATSQPSQQQQRIDPMKCESFFKVGGGFTAQDYATIRHITEGKWRKWDSKNPPTKYITLGGGRLQYERPDEWILPSESVVLCVKAASVTQTDTFATGCTLRFPRFKRLRTDKTWETALSKSEFSDLRKNVDKERQNTKFTVETRARKRLKTGTRTRKPLTVSGYELVTTDTPANNVPHQTMPSSHTDNNTTQIFQGLFFYVLTESTSAPTTGSTNRSHKLSKPALESLIKHHGGSIFQTQSAAPNILCIADRTTVRVASLKKSNDTLLIRSQWLFDCIAQAQIDEAHGLEPLVVPFEPGRHMFYAPEGRGGEEEFADNVDRFGDSYFRDVEVKELRELFEKMPPPPLDPGHAENIVRVRDHHRSHERIRNLLAADEEAGEKIPPGWILKDMVLYFPPLPPSRHTEMQRERQQRDRRLTAATAAFAGARVPKRLEDDDNEGVTHVVVVLSEVWDIDEIVELRKQMAELGRIPRLVTAEWVDVCVKEGTRVDEEAFTL